MPKGTAQIRCLHRSCCDSTGSALQTAAAAVAVRSKTPQAQAFRRGNASFLVAEGAAGYGRRKTTTRCLRVAAAAACAASLLQQQQQTWLRTRSSSSSTAFIVSPSVAGSDCPLLVALASDASESAATHVQQQQQHRQHQQPQKWHHQRPPFAGKMRPGCMPLLGEEAAADNPDKAAAAGEAAAAAASTGMPSEEAEVAAAPEKGRLKSAACAASLLQQQQQTWLRTRSSSSSTAFIVSPSVAGSDCPLLVALASDASESAATHVQQQQQHRQHQQPQKWHHQRPPFAGKMRPGCMPLLGKEAAADNPDKAAAAGEGAAAAASTGMPSEEAEVAAAPEGGEFVKLDKASFCKHEEATCLRVPLHQLQELSKALRKYLFKRRNLRPVIADTFEISQQEESQQQGQQEQPMEAQQQEQPEMQKQHQQEREGEVLHKGKLEGLPDLLQSLLKERGIQVFRHRVFLGYENLSVLECLAALLPEGVETPHRFECVGHIAHLNLPASLLKFKYAIGQVVLDKHPQLRTVVLKTGIGPKWRELQFELIAGEAAYVAKVKESDLVFEVDYAKAFWNSRLSCERQRITATIPRHAVVCKRQFLAEALCVASAAAEVAALTVKAYGLASSQVGNLVEVHNQDARDFLRSQAQPAAIAALLQKRMQAGETPSKAEGAIEQKKNNQQGADEVHVLMNLPELAIEFLDVFPGLFNESEPHPKRHRPDEEALSSNAATGESTHISKWRVHCYAFCRDPNPEHELKPRVEAALGCWPEPVEILEVRDVAPHKRMYCLTFDLPLALLRGEYGSNTRKAAAEPAPQ
ncbi:met-10 domain-containing protein, putative [Eimeria acervulina]|uniref:tRNA (guanine(37)-N1)-methyltransferase n=1 Tax=Eimeria acervulina TaxID=5801 RepID=U6GFX5_EIMAC|nr:met-10 domain-containing protein, putative [Eimeria acervulina]CDI78482.1 met-10 domain-containing protein, putative [Eimeria acervulina]